MMIGRVTDAGDHRKRRTHDCAHDRFAIEREEIFVGTASAREHDRIRAGCRRPVDRIGDLDVGSQTLYARFEKLDADLRRTHAQRFLKIFGTLTARGDERHDRRKWWNLALAGAREEP